MNAESEIKRRIHERGKITFAEFMEIALYGPQGGYYTGQERIGADGDYYTSPAVHPVFGALMAVQLYQMWRLIDCPARFTVLELGAGNGLLCRDIVSYASKLPDGFEDSLRYVCLDRRSATPIENGMPKTRRVLAKGVPVRGLQGCVISNEYLDAFAVHQVQMTDVGLKEVYVGWNGNSLVELTAELSSRDLASRLDELDINLVEGQTAEINLELDRWSEEVSAALDRGFVLTIDYGRTAPDLYDSDHRLRGTLVTYQQHVQTDSPLTQVGGQDITAQVDFTSAAHSGKKAGLDTLGLVTQRDFLSNLSLDRFQHRLREHELSPRQMQANRVGIMDLVRPGGLGDFKVLAQAKNVEHPALWGLQPSPECLAVVECLPVPLLTSHHISLPDGGYPSGEMEFQPFWPDGL